MKGFDPPILINSSYPHWLKLDFFVRGFLFSEGVGTLRRDLIDLASSLFRKLQEAQCSDCRLFLDSFLEI
jgi:hypothetical protein